MEGLGAGAPGQSEVLPEGKCITKCASRTKRAQPSQADTTSHRPVQLMRQTVARNLLAPNAQRVRTAVP